MDRTSAWASRRTAVAVAVVLAALLVALVAHTRISDSGDEPGMGLSQGDNDPATRMAATQFRVSTFNLLGAGHTGPGGDRPGWADGYTRMGWSVQLINENALSVIGFQEMRPVQFSRFKELTGNEFGTFPGNQLTEAAMANSVAWRKSAWRLVEARTIQIPYFEGNLIRMPYVLLQNRETGQRSWFGNFHNPASPPKYGDGEKWRDRATELEIGLVNQLRRDHPTTPVFLLGDFNEREEFFCRVSRRTGMNAANGGGIGPNGGCIPPARMPVDWIMGTPDVGFTQYVALRTPLVEKTTDHPLVFSDASIAPTSVQQSPIRRVVVVSIEGLRAGLIAAMPASDIPALKRLRAKGAGTLNARTVAERTTSLPNDVSLFTGRRVAAAYDGHGVRSEADRGGTVHALAGRYTSSVFDLVHNFGGTTALFSNKANLTLADRSWNGLYGGSDPIGLDDGRDKVDTFVVNRDARALTDAVVRQLATNPRTFTFVQLADPDRAGHARGFRSAAYADAVRRSDRFLNRILNTIGTSPGTIGRTLVIVTSEHGGSGREHTDRTVLANTRVPLLVWGPGVARGANLYTLNPHYTSPGRDGAKYGSPPPLRNAFVANLALMALRLPSVPGSRFNFEQDVNVFAGQ
jgi:hypothetical protein